jgi:hypothetical protein
LLVADGGPDLTVTGDLTVDGKIGIGSSPQEILTVIDASATGIRSQSLNTQATDTTKALHVSNGNTTDTFNVSYKGQGYFAGNVGIGVSPSTTLHVGGSTPTLRVSAGTSQIVELKADTGASILRTTTNHPLLFGTNDEERLRIDSSGNVFIGGTNASNADIALNANGTATFQGNVTAPNITSLNTLVEELQTKMSLIMRQIDISAETP